MTRFGGQTGHRRRSDVVHPAGDTGEGGDAPDGLEQFRSAGLYGSTMMGRFSGPPISDTSPIGPVWSFSELGRAHPG
jgi:hypothetical protein